MTFRKLENRMPSPQTAVDIFQGHWASDLSGALPGVNAGDAGLFDQRDPRPTLAAQYLGRGGSLAGMRILELGPLEGGHSFQLEKLGAAPVVAIEANAEAFLKCLIIKELLSLKTRFLFGDFIEYLEQRCSSGQEIYDMVFCSGVLYHMADPLRLISLISKATERCFVWSHYYQDGLPGREAHPGEREGFKTTYWVHSYGESVELGTFWGGNKPVAAWLYKDDILNAFRHFGFNEVQVLYDHVEGPSGPSFAFTAQKS